MPPKAAPMREGQQLQMGPVDAHGAGRDLVLADGHPGASDARILQPQADEDQKPDHQQAEIVDTGSEATPKE